MENGVVILLWNWVVILNWNQVLTLNWNWVVNITGICNKLKIYTKEEWNTNYITLTTSDVDDLPF